VEFMVTKRDDCGGFSLCLTGRAYADQPGQGIL
jgi:hypothetical protein